MLPKAFASLLLLAASGSALPSGSAGGKVYPGWGGIKNLFFFGDSYTTTEFNLTNGSPWPNAEEPMGNPPFPGRTSSNGPNWAGYLTTEFNKSEVLTYDLAYGGATIDSSLVQPYKPTVLSFKEQVSTLFLPYLANGLPWQGCDTLFFIWLGINDIGNSYNRGGDTSALHGELIQAYFSAVEDLYNAGARNFVFLNVPPVDRSPLTIGKGEGASELEKRVLAEFNSVLENHVNGFLARHSDVHGLLFDTVCVFNRVLDNPGEYGFKKGNEFCRSYATGTPQWDTYYEECGVRVDEYFWLNSLHPTWPMHKILAEEIAKAL